ncbi:MAG TPA: carboxypeptidase-like regulatory domain-containing protein [Planctomycetota bacterium]|nr:carboxypeptidase-like regulatory domain-containing protein [Planctomycetota bacterium]
MAARSACKALLMLFVAAGCTHNACVLKARSGPWIFVGRIVDSEGQPLRHARVHGSLVSSSGRASNDWTTDDAGSFRLQVPVVERGGDVWVTVDALEHGWHPNRAPLHVLHGDSGRPGVVQVGVLKLEGGSFAQRLDDTEMLPLLRTLSDGNRNLSTSHLLYEQLLRELQRRSPAVWIPELKSRWRYTEVHDSFGGEHREVVGDLEMLTVLRRLQGKPDPLRVQLETESIVALAPGDCVLRAQLANRDVEGATFHYQKGGNYRSGRLGRWTIEAVDAGGKSVPASDFNELMGGGMSSYVPLAPGESVEADLRLLHYVGPLRPGAYTLRLVYDDNEVISPPFGYDDLVVAVSAQVQLTVQPRVVTTTKEEQDALRRNFHKLDPDEPVLLLGFGSAGINPSIVAPKTPAEALLAAGWNAVPVLLDELQAETTSTGLRAWALALLYDITGLVDPESAPGAIDCATCVSYPRSINESLHVSAAFGSRTGNGLDPADQERLIGEWRGLRDMVRIEER